MGEYMGHIRIFKMKFGLVLFMLFAAAASASKVIHLTDCTGTFTVPGIKKSLSVSASKCLKLEPIHFKPVPIPAPCGKFVVPAGFKKVTKQEFLDAIAQCDGWHVDGVPAQSDEMQSQLWSHAQPSANGGGKGHDLRGYDERAEITCVVKVWGCGARTR